MKQMPSARFRLTYNHQSEPVEVTAHGKKIGTWYPEGSVPQVTVRRVDPSEDVTTPDKPYRMSIRPVKRALRPMHSEARRLLDPLDMKRAESERTVSRRR